MTQTGHNETSTSGTRTFEYLLAGEQISFQSAMQQIKEHLRTLREEEGKASKNLKDAETSLSELKQELERLSPDLEKLGSNAFDDLGWAASQDDKIRAALDRVSATRVKLSDAEAAKNKRQEESQKGIWGALKGAVGDILDKVEAHRNELALDYVELAKVIISSRENSTKLNQLAPEALVTRVREILQTQSSTEEQKISATSTLGRISNDINALTVVAQKNASACQGVDEFERCLDGFDNKVGETLRKYAAPILSKIELKNLNASIIVSTGDIKEPYQVLDAIFALDSDKQGLFSSATPSKAFDGVKRELRLLCKNLGGDAVINCQFEYRNASTPGGNFQVIEIFAYGTAVKIKKPST